MSTERDVSNMNDILQENVNYFISNIDWFKAEDPRLKLKNKHFALAGVNKFIKFNSSPRGIMANSMLSQTIVLNEPLPNKIYSVVDDELGRFTISKKVEANSEVISVIKRHRNMETGDASERVVIVRDLSTGEVNAIEIPNYNKLHPYFGFEYKLNEDLDNLVRGDILPKDTILAKPPTLSDDGAYGFGRDVNVVLMSLDEDDEDGLLVSEELCEEFSYKVYDTFTLDIDEDEFLLNAHGDAENYKPLLDIGDTITNGGIVFGKRKSDVRYNPVILSNEELCKINPIFDEVLYSRKDGGIIKDIKVFRNPKRKKVLPTHTTELLDRYYNSSLLFYRQIINVYEQLNNEYFKLYNENLVVGDTFNRLIVEAYGIIESAKEGSKLKKTYKLAPLGLYRIEVTVEFNMVPSIGAKFSDLSGNKGTTVKTKPRREMPKDVDGNIADIAMDVKSTPARLNGGRLYDQYIKSAMLRVEKLTIDKLSTFNKQLDELTKDEILTLFDIPYGFVRILRSKFTVIYNQAYESKDYDGMLSVLESIVNRRFSIEMNVGDDYEPYLIAHDIRNSIYKPCKSYVTYINNGRVVTSDEPIMIGPMYIILLSKIADSLLTTSSAAVNHHGMPIVVSKNDKNNMPHKNNPVRALGETEKRIIVNEGGRELAAELSDINASLESHGLVYESILSADVPTNIEKNIDRKKHPYGTDRGLQILNTLNKSVGKEIIHIKDNDRFVDVDGVEEEDMVMLDLGTTEDLDEK